MTAATRGRQPIHKRHRGATIVLVLGLLAVTLAVSYAMMRTQVTSLQIQANVSRRGDARLAALTGMSTALRRIHEPSWEGVDAPISGVLSDGAGYQVTFETGDPSLQPEDAEYSEFPFRLSITSKGYASDPRHGSQRAEYHVRTVVQLVRRALSSEPPAWSDLQRYNVVQWANRDSCVQFPVRIEGPVKLGGRLNFCSEYPGDGQALRRYLRDLDEMRLAGWGDHRPFGDKVYLPYSRNSSSTLWLLNESKTTIHDVAEGGAAPLSHPYAPTSYRLYPGGREYPIPVIQATYGSHVSHVTLAPDPATNPLGVFRSDGALRLGDATTIQGAIITHGYEPDIYVTGDNVNWSSMELPRLYGQPDAEKMHLPAGMVKDDFRVASGARLTFQGALTVWDEMEVLEGSADTSLIIKGHVFAEELLLRGRSSWKWSDLTWFTFYQMFLNNLNFAAADPYFPHWLEWHYGMKTAPKITIRPSEANVKHHWQDWSQPVYVPHPNDAGLIWDVLQWNESSSFE